MTALALHGAKLPISNHGNMTQQCFAKLSPGFVRNNRSYFSIFPPSSSNLFDILHKHIICERQMLPQVPLRKQGCGFFCLFGNKTKSILPKVLCLCNGLLWLCGAEYGSPLLISLGHVYQRYLENEAIPMKWEPRQNGSQ